MSKALKYVLKSILFFTIMLIILYLLDTFYKDIHIIANSIASTMGYVIVLLTEEHKKAKNNKT